jgi:hypothetical protein
MTLVYVDPVEAYAWLCVCVFIYESIYLYVSTVRLYVYTYVGIFECRPVCMFLYVCTVCECVCMFVVVWCFILRRYFSILCSVHDRVTGEW